MGCSGRPGICNCSPSDVNYLDFAGGINSDIEFSAGAIDENLSWMGRHLYRARNLISLWINDSDLSIIPSGVLTAISGIELVHHGIVCNPVHPGGELDGIQQLEIAAAKHAAGTVVAAGCKNFIDRRKVPDSLWCLESRNAFHPFASSNVHNLHGVVTEPGD